MKRQWPVVPSVTVRWVGIFNLENVYKKSKYWLDYEGFGPDNFEEQEYLEYVKGDSKELHWTWYSEKKESDYFSYVIKLKALIVKLKQVEVTKDNRKLKMFKGDIKMWLESYVLTDCQDKWKSYILQRIYENIIIRERILKHRIELYKKAYNFQDELKRYLDLQAP